MPAPVFTRNAIDVLAVADIFGNARGPNNGELLTWGVEMQQALADNAAAIDAAAAAVLAKYGVVTKSTSYAVALADDTLTHVLSASTPTTVTVGPILGFITNTKFTLRWYNDTACGHLLNIDGIAPFYILPDQFLDLQYTPGGWRVRTRQMLYKPSAPIVLNVDAAGSNSNDGLSTGPGRAFGDLAYALQFAAANLDVTGTAVSISVSAGLFNVGAGLLVNYGAWLKNIHIVGSGSGSTTIACLGGGQVFSARDGAVTLSLGALTLSTFGNGSTLLSASQNVVLDFGAGGSIAFNSAPLGNHIIVATWSSINPLGNYDVNGSAVSHFICGAVAYFNYGGLTVTGAPSLVFTVFAVCISNGVVSAGGVAMTFSGFAGVAGQRYAGDTGGMFDTNSTVFPGNTAGTTSNGSFFR